MANSTLREFDFWRNSNPHICFLGLLGSGSLLLGSSIAYPMLSQDSKAWASAALMIFFPSAGVFNTFKIPEIYLYGHYTLALCIVAIILEMSFGQNSLPDHARFIPVYVMGSTFLTAAWPSLFQSIGLPPKTLDDMATPHDYMPVPMSEVHVEDETSQHIFVGAPSPRDSLSDWYPEPVRQSSPSPSVSTSTPPESGDKQPRNESSTPLEVLFDIAHMGPSSTYSGGTSHTGTSLSLGSQSDLPSEMSSNVAVYFCGGTAAHPAPKTTQRRREIEALGRIPSGRDMIHNRVREGARGSVDLTYTMIHKSQTM